MAISNNQFKQYQRGTRTQSAEEDFSKGIKFVQTPLDTGENKLIINYDLHNDGKSITPRRGIRVNEIAMPFSTPDLYSHIDNDLMLSHTAAVSEEDGKRYNLFVANTCSSSEVGLHSGPAELWVEDKEGAQYTILSNVEARDLYAINMSYTPDTVKDEPLTSSNSEFFFTINSIDPNCSFSGSSISVDTAYSGGLCFKTGVHPFTVSITSNNTGFALYKAKLYSSGWGITGAPIGAITEDSSFSLDASTSYYIYNNTGVAISDGNPYLSVTTTVQGATVNYINVLPSGNINKVYTYQVGTAVGTMSTIAGTVNIDTSKYFKKITTAGTKTFTYLKNTITLTTTVPGATLTVDRSLYNRLQPQAGVTTFKYVLNTVTSNTTNVAGAFIEIDPHKFNRAITEAGTTTFTYSSTADAWQLSGNNIVLANYGIRFKDSAGNLEDGKTITIVTAEKNMWQLDDFYVRLSDYGITLSGGTPREGDAINIKSITANTWLDANNNYIKASDYGFEIFDTAGKLQDGDTITVVSSAPTGWYYNSVKVDLLEEGIELTDSNNAVVNDSTITLVFTAPVYNSSAAFGTATHDIPGSMYYIPRDANGNGFDINNKRIAMPIGCFAWNNNYYNFNSHGELVRSRYQVDDPELGITRTYYTETITPKEVNVSEAISSGFNMLSPDPYTFKDSFEEGDINLQGIMLYDEDNNLISEPQLNTPYKLRCFYSVQRGTRYKIKWDYREVNTSEWLDIDEDNYYYNDSSLDAPAQLIINSFSSPIENCIIRVRAFKWIKEPVISYSTSVANASVIINADEIKEKFPEADQLTFVYDGTNWKYNDKIISLDSYGITFSDVTQGLTTGSTLTITIDYKELFSSSSENMVTMSIVFATVLSSTTANKDLKTYDLSRCTGMTYWKGHIWVYGLIEDPTVLFASDVNEPTYFPYPNNVDIFDEPILLCIPFNENMLVFTRSFIYQLTLADTGGWTKVIIQGNMNFTEFDMEFVRIVKNMVFFKSRDYYYMIVPKTLSLKNELAIAPVSKNIEELLDDFVHNIPDIFREVYNYTDSITLVAHFNFLNYEDVHNVYTFETSSGLLINFDLLYNTVSRYWRIHMYESQELYKPIREDATKQSAFYAPIHLTFVYNSAQYYRLGVQILNAEETSVKDKYIPVNSIFHNASSEVIGSAIVNSDVWAVVGETVKMYDSALVTGTLLSFLDGWQIEDTAIQESFDALHTYKNTTYLDCGYRNIITDLKKRCRELQFKFNNTSGKINRFITEFILDGEYRIRYYRYNTEYIYDPQDFEYGTIYLDRQEIDDVQLIQYPYGNTVLPKYTSELLDANAWEYDPNKLPEVHFWKARFKVSGKGYTPRFKLRALTEEDYELMGYTWVYRTLYSR